MPVRLAVFCGKATVMIMTTECGANGGKAAADDPELAITAIDAEVKREATPPSSPAVSLKSVQERLSRFGSTVKFRTEAAAAAESEAASEAAEEEEEDESCNQPQDLSVKRRDQGSQTDCDRARVTIRKMASQRPPAPEAAPSAPHPSDMERMLRIWLVLFRRLAAAGAMQNKSSARLSKVDYRSAMWPFRRC